MSRRNNLKGKYCLHHDDKKYTIYNHTTIFAALIVEEFDFDYSEGCVHIASRTYNYKGVRR